MSEYSVLKNEHNTDLSWVKSADGRTVAIGKPEFTEVVADILNKELAVAKERISELEQLLEETSFISRSLTKITLAATAPIVSADTHVGRQAAENERQEVINEKMGVTLTLSELDVLAKTCVTTPEANNYQGALLTYLQEKTSWHWDENSRMLYHLNNQYNTEANRQAIAKRKAELGGKS